MHIRVQFNVQIPPFIEDVLDAVSDEEREDRLRRYKNVMVAEASRAASEYLIRFHNKYIPPTYGTPQT